MKNQRYINVLKRLTGAAAVVLLGVGIFAQDASAGIANTKHNLTGALGGAAARNNSFTPTSGNGEICVFCHTPHGSDTSAAVPLWNRKLGTPTDYTTYNSLGTSSLDGATAPVGSVSLACLSCHDGTQAMNVMINKPGSGGYNPAGSALAGSWGTSTNVDANGKLAGTNLITLISTDLTNDHPIGIQYAGGPKAGTVPAPGAADYSYTNDLFRDADFKAASGAVLNGNSVWWVDTEATPNGTREKSDMQLYTRTGAAAVNGSGVQLKDGNNNPIVLAGAQPFVECASCHDPHTENVTFLRMTDGNKNSQICLSCHTK
ncbi:MAG TPA: cytochrome c3 family protein [Noviherbaspirillum sp.]|nr:cytochrome c3 family protein [Noviherbaspirillum sp.]